jgi:DNA-binding transcriptional regulator GbsR (MarR family)
MPTLPENLKTFIAQWGEMASHWGLNRTEAQIHALLFLSPKPLDAEEISTTLTVARSHVSNSLKELQRWGIVKTVHVLGNRREHFESLKDVWEIFRTLVDEQKRREIDPWRAVLKESSAAMGKDSTYAKQRMEEMLEFFETLSTWYEEMRRLPTPMVKTFLTLGGKTAGLLGLGKK